MATAFVGVEAVITDGLLALGRNVINNGGEEISGFEDLEVAFGVVVALGAVDDGLGGGVPGDFLEREGMAEEILGKAFATGGVMRGDGFLAATIDVEAAVFPGKQVGEPFGAEVFAVAEGLEETVAEEFDGGGAAVGWHTVEASFGIEQAVGGEDVEVRVEEEVIAEGVDSGDSREAAIGKVEAGSERIEQGVGGGLEKQVEEVAALAEDAAQDFGAGEDVLPVGDLVADG